MTALLAPERSLVLHATLRVNRSILSEEEARRYSDEEVRQMNAGFTALFIEAIESKRNDVRSMIIDTMIPGLVAKGETSEGIAWWTGAFMVAITHEMLTGLPAELHEAATDWLCTFSGEYLRDVVRAAISAEKG